jgi:hypothetical protein
MRAVVVRPATAKVRRRVAIGSGPGLDALKEAVAHAGRDGKGSPYLEVVAPNDRDELSVRVDKGFFAIADQNDHPLPRITPPLAVVSPDAVRQLVARLEHVVRYRNAWELHNGDEASRLRDLLAISVERRNVGRGAGRVALRPGDEIRVLVHNRSTKPLQAALLYFAPDWSIRLLWPDGVGFTELQPTGEAGFAVADLQAELPAGVTQTTERLKLFAAESPTSFDALTLASLDKAPPGARSVTRSLSAAPLENLLADMAEGKATRELVISRRRAGDWGTAELELETTAR